jgi:hypothetical protein
LLNNREGYVPAPTSYNLSANMQSWFAKNYRKLTVNYNSTLDRAPYNMALGALFSNSSFFMDTDLPFSSAWEINVKHIPSRSILFGSWGNKTIDITSCALSAQYLTANVSCQSHNSTARTQCSVIAVRQMPNPPTVSNFTVLGMDPVGRGLMKVLPVVISNRGMNGSTPTEMYLADPGTTFRTDGSAVQLSATPIGVFQERLALLINSFILAARYSTLVMGREDLSGSNISVQTVTKRVSVAPAYALDGPWFGLFLLANVVMLGASLVALALKLSCSGPEVLGYVSSLTRDSPHFSMDGNFNSTVDGAERSRLMRNLRVRLGDVRLGEDTGKIAFAPLLESGVAKRGRLYE